jgi:glycine/D-amino acid oxidase-like deaminating enzyme
MGDFYQTVVIGAGCAGASVAYHLSKLGVKTLVLERGQVGKGLNSKMSVSLGDLRGGEESTFMPNISGTNVFSLPTTTKVKMMVTLYASKSEEFIRHHGIEGAKKYLRLANMGIQTQKSVARSIFGKHTPAYLNELGSLYVCHEHELSEFKREFALLKSLVDTETSIEWWDKESVEKEHGSNSGFVAGIYFRNDAVIDSTKYANELLNVAVESGHVKLLTRCSPVVSTGTVDGKGIVRLEDRTCFCCDHVIIATGAFYADDITGPLLRPCWSYLSAINSGPNHNLLPGNRSSKSNISASNNTMNYFTFGFTHDCTFALQLFQPFFYIL